MSINDELSRRASSQHYNIIRKPILTEKCAKLGVLTLSVDPRASKTAIREAVERVFRVKVTGVRTVNYAGKPKRVGRSVGSRSGYKKAYVSLAEGSDVNVLEGV